MAKTKPAKLKSVTVSGYKSFGSEPQTLEVGDVTVLLGANGSGKSNLVSLFQLLNFLTNQGLAEFVGRSGGPDALLHYGVKTTNHCAVDLVFETSDTTSSYGITLAYAARDRLIFTREVVNYSRKDHPQPSEHHLDVGKEESQLADSDSHTCKVMRGIIGNCRVYQFHDTSASAKIRQSGYINDNRYLRSDAGNLAAYLHAMGENKETRSYYERIVRHVRLAFPLFGDFDLHPLKLRDNNIMLEWREMGSDLIFGPHQLSDGTLRFIALTTLLLQPPSDLPAVIILDEPELGLHPSALNALCAMVKRACQHSQVILSTQSPQLVDEFDPESIVIIERDPKSKSVLKRLDAERLGSWLQEYTLSELWEKNVLGGKP